MAWNLGHKAMGESTEPKGIQFAAVWTSEDAVPQDFYNYWYHRITESFVFLVSALFGEYQVKNFLLFFGGGGLKARSIKESILDVKIHSQLKSNLTFFTT